VTTESRSLLAWGYGVGGGEGYERYKEIGGMDILIMTWVMGSWVCADAKLCCLFFLFSLYGSRV
jgi:hypothetical protein